MTTLTADHSTDRYHRQMLLPFVGEAGQAKLLKSTALVVGCGALGTVIVNMLARAGVGRLVVVDRDFVELSNLQRQVLFDEDDVNGLVPKAEAARAKIARINSQVQVIPLIQDLNHTNIEQVALEGDYGPVDIIIDGVDNFETRFIVNDTAVKHGIPYIYGGAVGTVGMCYAVLPHTPAGDKPWEIAGRATPCLRCIFEQAPPPGMNPTCDTAGVLGPVVSIVSNYESIEAMKVLLGRYESVNPNLVSVDCWENQLRQLKVGRAYDVGECTCCKKRNFEWLDGVYSSSTTTLCGRDAVQLTLAPGESKLNLVQIADRLKAHGQVKLNPFMLQATVSDNAEAFELTLFKDGRAIVKGTKQPTRARAVYAKFIGS
ncbi:MAG: ThiF family adenylyltransferase [Phycisphaeraceae bacterium]|nr:ThiF family adenylyltransferase [Phycisphaeraceae bacterium]